MYRPSSAIPSPATSFDGDLTLRLLGDPALERVASDGARQHVLGPGKPLALLAYLAVVPQHEASREFLADLLWGDDSVSDPLHSLRNAILLISKQVNSALLEATPSRCRLARALPTDLARLTKALGGHDLECAMALYTGEFLPDFAAPGCREFEHWCESIRLRVRTDVVNAADVLVRQLLDAGRPRDAERHARRMVELDPMNQRGRRTLLETLIAGGDRIGALTEATVTEQWLAGEEIEPEAATAALLHQARRTRTVARLSGVQDAVSERESLESSSDLVGRAAEFAAIIKSWEEARAGTTRLVSIVAGAGLGKSRLLADVENRLRAQRAQIVSLRALTDERAVPFSFVAAIASELARLPGAAAVSASTGGILVGLDASLSSVFHANADFAASDRVLRRARAMQDLLACVAEERAVVVLLDDMHRADDSSLAVIPAMLARLSASRVLVVAASRPGRGAVLSERANQLTLAPLTLEQVGQLVASIRPLPQLPWGEALVHGVYSASRGVPVFALLALRDVMERGLVRLGETAWECEDASALELGLRDATALPTSLRNLSERARRVLLQLAVAGRSVPLEMLADDTTSEPSHSLPEALDTLERRALIVRVGDLVSPAHDVVAESALAGASDHERRAAARSMALEMLGSRDSRWQERGVRLFATVATPSELALRLDPLLRHAPLPRGVELARTLSAWIGDSPDQLRLARTVARQLPLSLRLRPFRRLLAGAGVAASLFAAIPLWNVTHRDAPVDTTLVSVRVTDDGVTEAFEAPLTMSGWDASTAIDGRVVLSGAAAVALSRSVRGSRVLQSTGERLSEHVYGDSGGSDIDVTTVIGRVTRLTSSPGDDVPNSWSPDGRFIVFQSSRWSALRHHRLGVLDRTTGAVRQLTRSDGRDGEGSWSPDGSRIAFTRTFLDGRPAELCVVSIGGHDERCTATVAQLLGWRSPLELIVYSDNKVLGMHSDSAVALDTLVGEANNATLSPNGRWLAWWRGTPVQRVEFVAPSSDPRQARRMGRNTGRADGLLVWGPSGVAAPFIERIAVTSLTDTVIVGVPHRFGVVAKWSDSSDAAPPYVRWRLGAAGDGDIDSAGTLVAKRIGTIVVVASAGGWRTTSRRVVAINARMRLIATENWLNGLAGWRVFGNPSPALVQDQELGGALLNNGDGSYFSGAYYRTTLHWTRGLAVDAVISTPVTELQWQTVDVQLYPAIDAAALAAWDHRTGFMPAGSQRRGAECVFEYPGREGIDGLSTILPLAAFSPSGSRRSLPLANGRPYRVRLQVFPDGRCGMAVNGAPLFVSSGHFANRAPLRLVTYGNSWRTRMLLGTVTIVEGVPNDIDWTRISREIPSMMPPGPPPPSAAVSNRPTPPPPKR